VLAEDDEAPLPMVAGRLRVAPIAGRWGEGRLDSWLTSKSLDTLQENADVAPAGANPGPNASSFIST